jgi:hypothetical protein
VAIPESRTRQVLSHIIRSDAFGAVKFESEADRWGIAPAAWTMGTRPATTRLL